MKIEVLFPEICNLFGDLGNVRYLAQSYKDAEIINTSLKMAPKFASEKVDLIYMGTTTEHGLKLAIEALKPYKENLISLIEEGQCILLTGNALDIFGKYIESDDAERIEGLGIFNTHAEYHMLKRHNSFFLGNLISEYDDIKVVGFKSIFGHTYTDESDMTPGFFEKIRGVGRNPESEVEGFVKNNLMATYLIGPILPLNPLLTEWLLEKMGYKCEAAFRETSMKAYELRVKEMEDESLHPIY